jgi:hypothetical protein
VGRLSAVATHRLGASAAVAALTFGTPLLAQWHGDASDQRAPVYQRRAFEWSFAHRERRNDKHDGAAYFRWPQVNAGWFQRPYPYHLDYYRMRYGGSYAPYFGNLYGPPQVVTAPPYYGPYYGGFGYPAGADYNGGVGVPVESPSGPVTQGGNETLPAPKP